LISREPKVVSHAPHGLAQFGHGSKQWCCAFLQQPVFRRLAKLRREIAQPVIAASIYRGCQELFGDLLTALAQLSLHKWQADTGEREVTSRALATLTFYLRNDKKPYDAICPSVCRRFGKFSIGSTSSSVPR
jgi:hypothetical protein